MDIRLLLTRRYLLLRPQTAASICLPFADGTVVATVVVPWRKCVAICAYTHASAIVTVSITITFRMDITKTGILMKATTEDDSNNHCGSCKPRVFFKILCKKQINIIANEGSFWIGYLNSSVVSVTC